MSEEEIELFENIKQGNEELFDYIREQSFSENLLDVYFSGNTLFVSDLTEPSQNLLKEMFKVVKNGETSTKMILEKVSPYLTQVEKEIKKGKKSNKEEEEKIQKVQPSFQGKSPEEDIVDKLRKSIFGFHQPDGRLGDGRLDHSAQQDQPSLLTKNKGPYKRPAAQNVQSQEINDLECICDCDFAEIIELMETKEMKQKLKSFISKKLISQISNAPKAITMKGDLKKYQLVEEINIADELGEWRFHPFFDRMTIYLIRKNEKDFPVRWSVSQNFELDKIQIKIEERKLIQKSSFGSGDLTLVKFLEDLAEKYEKDKKQAEIWADALYGQAVDTVEELLKWESRDFEELKAIPKQIKIVLQQELNKFKFKSMNGAEGELNEAERKGIAHKIKRYFYFKDGEGDKFGYIDQKVLELAFNEVKTYYEGETLLEQIKTFYLGYSVPMKKKGNIILERGMILYGPPGTGKTVLTDDLPLKMGLTPISHSLSASEVNRGIVGQTEKLLLELCNRATKMPHLLCCVSIDEIDSLVPKRDEKSSQHKTDGIAVLLAVIGGIRDVSNLVILASTNRLNQIDDAIKRRLSGQFFVGRPSPLSRKKMIERVNKEKNEANNTDLIIMDEAEIQESVKMTTNFSGAALKMLVSKLLVDYKTQKKEGKLNLSDIVKYATLTSKQFSIKLGTFYLPELFQKRIEDKQKNIKEEMKAQCTLKVQKFTNIESGLPLENMLARLLNHTNPSKYKHAFTGRIIINLSDIVKTHIEYQLREDLQLLIEERIIMSSTLNDLLPRFADFVSERNIDYVQLFNSDFLLDSNAFDETKIMENINEKLQELGAYDRSLLLIDMDSLCGVNISKSESGMGPTTSFSLSNGKLFNFAIHAITTKVQMTEKKEIWIALACKHPYLLNIAKTSLNWRKTPKQIEKDNIEEENNTRVKFCKNCQQKYLEVDNKLGTCSYHDGFLFESAKRPDLWQPLEDEATINMVKADPKVNELGLKYICCLESVMSQGCKKDKHSQQGFDPVNYYDKFVALKKARKE